MSCIYVVEASQTQKVKVEILQSSSIGCGTLTAPLKKVHQEASSILRGVFACSKRPHFNSTYAVRVPFLTGVAVYEKFF